jgi:hypothetical protein
MRCGLLQPLRIGTCRRKSILISAFYRGRSARGFFFRGKATIFAAARAICDMKMLKLA